MNRQRLDRQNIQSYSKILIYMYIYVCNHTAYIFRPTYKYKFIIILHNLYL